MVGEPVKDQLVQVADPAPHRGPQQRRNGFADREGAQYPLGALPAKPLHDLPHLGIGPESRPHDGDEPVRVGVDEVDVPTDPVAQLLLGRGAFDRRIPHLAQPIRRRPDGRQVEPVALSAQGARVAVSARREPELRTLPIEHVLPADLSVRGAAATLAERAAEALGGIDILINNAGVSVIGSQSVLADDDEARASFETNFWTPLALTRAALPAMPDGGTIVNVTSTVQAVPLPMLGYYASSKSALAQATRALRHELRHTRIRVLEVVPGATDTPLRDIDLLPWRGKPPRTLPPVPPESVAAAIVKALRHDKRRVVHPKYSLLPLELPVVGRLVASIAARRIRTEPETPPAR